MIKKYIEIGSKVFINSSKMAEYRKEKLKEYINKKGLVTTIYNSYQAETMYSVLFKINPFIQKDFFEHEVTLINS